MFILTCFSFELKSRSMGIQVTIRQAMSVHIYPSGFNYDLNSCGYNWFITRNGHFKITVAEKDWKSNQ